MKLRQAIVPAAQFGSGIAPWLIIAGLLIQITGLAVIGLIGFAGAVALHLCHAAGRDRRVGQGARLRQAASAWSGRSRTGARDVLKAAAWTYVAGALAALLTFLYYVFLIFGRRD